jgi:DNA replication and repair protein RecF
MPLTQFEAHNVRIFEYVTLKPDPCLNIIAGDNGSGKTTLLEAIHFLGTGRSFRTPKAELFLRQHSDALLITGRFQASDRSTIPLGIQRDRHKRQISVGGQEHDSSAVLAQTMPLQIISPDTHYSFLHSARQRRGVLDWGLFHVEPNFFPLWSRYQRILNQRNAGLRNGLRPPACFAWDPDLCDIAEQIQTHRAGFMQNWEERFRHYCAALLADAEVSLELHQGWRRELGLSQALMEDRERDMQRGTTHSGAHRADLAIKFNSKSSRDNASHGQQKLLVIALRLAQLDIFLHTTGSNCIVLIDDLAAELDRERRERLMQTLAGMNQQVFATTTDPTHIDHSAWNTHQVFHVKQGVVEETSCAMAE